MPSFFDTYNASVLAIPALHILSILPHTYALNVATQGKLGEWDNRNPRSTTMKAKLKERLDSETYDFYERLEACHANGMENLPLFATTIVLGNLAGLKKEGFGGLNGFAASFLAVRLAYTAFYVLTGKSQTVTLARGGLWAAGLGLCFRVIIKSARVLGGSRLGL
jgi:uncharacterized MAPEG superfamily protein